MTTHLYGFGNTIKPIHDICQKKGLLFFEDSAQALSTKVDGKMAGTFGKFGVYSFSYPKNVCTFYGGALVTDDDGLAEKVRENISGYINLYKKFYYQRVLSSLVKDVMTMDVLYPLIVSKIIRLAYKHDISCLKNQVEVHLPVRLFDEIPNAYLRKVSGFEGKLIINQLPGVEKDARHRINAALLYDQGLKDIPEIGCPKYYPDFTHTYLYYPIEVPDRINLMKYMIDRKKDVAYQHIPNCASKKTFSRYRSHCPNAENAANNTLTLPTYGKYMLDEVEKTVSVIREYFGKEKYNVN
jgi:dTDP-4-amino-4,6-dideoxygalactose transaminase